MKTIYNYKFTGNCTIIISFFCLIKVHILHCLWLWDLWSTYIFLVSGVLTYLSLCNWISDILTDRWIVLDWWSHLLNSSVKLWTPPGLRAQPPTTATPKMSYQEESKILQSGAQINRCSVSAKPKELQPLNNSSTYSGRSLSEVIQRLPLPGNIFWLLPRPSRVRWDILFLQRGLHLPWSLFQVGHAQKTSKKRRIEGIQMSWMSSLAPFIAKDQQLLTLSLRLSPVTLEKILHSFWPICNLVLSVTNQSS